MMRPRFSPVAVVGLTAADRAAQTQAAPPAAVVQFDPALYPPEGSLPVLLTDRIKNAAPGVSIFPAGAQRKVDRGYLLVIDAVELLALAPVDDTLATWAILADGVPIAGLGALTMQFRAASSQSRDFEKLRTVIQPGVTVSVALNNLDGVVRTYGVQLVGWTYRK